MAAIERASLDARAAAAGEAGSLAIGFTMCAAYSVAPGYARRFNAKYPEIDLSLREALSNDLVAQVAENRIDAAIVFPQPLPTGLRKRTVWRDPLCLALPRAHRLATRRGAVLAECAREPFVAASIESAASLRRVVFAQCARAGFEPSIVMEVQLQQTILSLVAEGVGVALVPAAMAKARLDAVVFRKLPAAEEIGLDLVWRDANHNPCLANLLSLAPEVA